MSHCILIYFRISSRIKYPCFSFNKLVYWQVFWLQQEPKESRVCVCILGNCDDTLYEDSFVLISSQDQKRVKGLKEKISMNFFSNLTVTFETTFRREIVNIWDDIISQIWECVAAFSFSGLQKAEESVQIFFIFMNNVHSSVRVKLEKKLI